MKYIIMIFSLTLLGCDNKLGDVSTKKMSSWYNGNGYATASKCKDNYHTKTNLNGLCN